MTSRRELLQLGAAAWIARLPQVALCAPGSQLSDSPDHQLRISKGLIELSPEHIVSTTLYNGQFPGPLLRLKEGRAVDIDIRNDTDSPELVHWHGQSVPSDVDGAAEEGSPLIPAHGTQRVRFVPQPAGLRFYHTHMPAGDDLNRGTYSAQTGLVYVEPRQEPGAYDLEVFLTLKEFLPSLSRGGDMAMDVLAGAALPELQSMGKEAAARSGTRAKGYEVSYELFGINGRMLGRGEPVRVRQGQRVLFHVVNASATEIRSLALPGHVFTIMALDGNAVPTPAKVPVLWLGTAERVSAVVEMNHPGVWVMGDLADDDRARGMGVVVEYAGRKGAPQWVKPTPFHWDYTLFGDTTAAPAEPDEKLDFTIVKNNAALGGFNQWTLNGEAFSMKNMSPRHILQRGRRYRVKFRNASDDIHPLHLHRHTFELVRVGGRLTSGVRKDVVMLGGYQELEFDFIADNPGPTLFHCHQQLHMDFGFMGLFDYA